MQWESEAPGVYSAEAEPAMAEAEPAMMAEEEPVMMESEQAPPSLAAEEPEAPVFGEEVMVEEAAAEESMEAEALPMMMSEEPALSEVTAEAEPPAPPPDLTNEQRAALAAFDTMDTDGDGELSDNMFEDSAFSHWEDLGDSKLRSQKPSCCAVS